MSMSERMTHPITQKFLNTFIDPVAEQLIQTIVSEEKLPIYKSLFQINLEPEFQNKMQEHLAEGKKMIFLANHRSHVDGLAAMYATEVLTEELNLAGVLLLVAGSIRAGFQGNIVKKLADASDRLLADHFLYTVPVIRPVDRKMGMEGDNSTAFDLLNNAPPELPILIFPEGNLKGGTSKRIFSSQRKGLMVPEIETQKLLKILTMNGDTMIIPMGIVNTEKIFSPDLKVVTLQALMEFYLRQKPDHRRGHMASVTIGEPYKISELKNEGLNTDNAALLSDYMMRSLSQLLPEKDRGAYI